MEIFNAVSKQANAATTTSSPVEVAKVEHVEIQQDTTQKAQNETNKAETSEKLSHAVEKLNTHMEELGTNITFGYNEKINSMFVSVFEKDSQKLLRKIPSESVMKLAETMRDFIGAIFDERG